MNNKTTLYWNELTKEENELWDTHFEIQKFPLDDTIKKKSLKDYSKRWSVK